MGAEIYTVREIWEREITRSELGTIASDFLRAGRVGARVQIALLPGQEDLDMDRVVTAVEWPSYELARISDNYSYGLVADICQAMEWEIVE